MGGLAVGSLTLAAVDVRLASGRPSQGAGIDARPHRFGDLPASSRPFLGTWPRKSLHRIHHRRSSARATRETVAVQCGAVRRALRSPGRAGSRHASVKRPGRRKGCPSGYSMQRKTRHEGRGATCEDPRTGCTRWSWRWSCDGATFSFSVDHMAGPVLDRSPCPLNRG
jgi:hypothetical protein